MIALTVLHVLSAAPLAPAPALPAASARAEDHAAVPRASLSASPATYTDGGRPRRIEPMGPRDAVGRYPVKLFELDTGRVARAEAGPDAIATLTPGADPGVVLPAAGLTLVRALLPTRGLYLVTDEGRDGVALAARFASALPPEVVEVVPDLAFVMGRADIGVPPDDDRYGGQWYLDKIGIEAAWAFSDGDPAISIGIVDNGCDLAHPDLVAKWGAGLDVVDADLDPSYVPAATCTTDEECCPGGPLLGACCTEGGHCATGNVHGTACAGIVAASTDNEIGIAGVCPECSLRCIRFLTDGPTPVSSSVEVFNYALEQGIDVLSNSWGYSQPIAVPASLASAIEAFYEEGRGGKGGVVVFASGNDDREIGDDELLAARGVIGVGATTVFDERTSFSNTGHAVDLAAPGGTLSTDISGPDGDDPGDYTSGFGGTSAACPVVAGVAGLVLSADPELTSAELADLLVTAARPAPYATPDENGHDPEFGYGIIDPATALATLFPDPDAGSAEPDPEPETPPSGCPLFGGGAAALLLPLSLLRLRRRRGSRGRRGVVVGAAMMVATAGWLLTGCTPGDASSGDGDGDGDAAPIGPIDFEGFIQDLHPIGGHWYAYDADGGHALVPHERAYLIRETRAEDVRFAAIRLLAYYDPATADSGVCSFLFATWDGGWSAASEHMSSKNIKTDGQVCFDLFAGEEVPCDEPRWQVTFKITRLLVRDGPLTVSAPGMFLREAPAHGPEGAGLEPVAAATLEGRTTLDDLPDPTSIGDLGEGTSAGWSDPRYDLGLYAVNLPNPGRVLGGRYTDDGFTAKPDVYFVLSSTMDLIRLAIAPAIDGDPTAGLSFTYALQPLDRNELTIAPDVPAPTTTVVSAPALGEVRYVDFEAPDLALDPIHLEGTAPPDVGPNEGRWELALAWRGGALHLVLSPGAILWNATAQAGGTDLVAARPPVL